MFYLGGTKCGALFGEAVVFTKGNTPKHFLTQIKQHGALLAKGWLLGLQFGTLFTDDLYLRIAANANRQADRIREALRERGYTLTFEAPTTRSSSPWTIRPSNGCRPMYAWASWRRPTTSIR